LELRWLVCCVSVDTTYLSNSTCSLLATQGFRGIINYALFRATSRKLCSFQSHFRLIHAFSEGYSGKLVFVTREVVYQELPCFQVKKKPDSRGVGQYIPVSPLYDYASPPNVSMSLLDIFSGSRDHNEVG